MEPSTEHSGCIQTKVATRNFSRRSHMRKRQNTLKPSLGSFVNVSVIADTKSYPTHKNVVSMIREERRDYQSPVV
jgi:hypothetical protein